MEEQAKRFNKNKPKYSILPLKELEPVVRVLEFGATKYDRDNWRKGLPKEEIMDSLLRHLVCLQEGELIDSESGEHHAAHLCTNAIFLLAEYNKSSKTPLSKKSLEDIIMQDGDEYTDGEIIDQIVDVFNLKTIRDYENTK